MLGTVVRPHHRDGEYDLDLVSQLDVPKPGYTDSVGVASGS